MTFPESWNRKSEEERESDLRAICEEEGIPYDEDDAPLSPEMKRIARRANRRALSRYVSREVLDEMLPEL